MRAFDYVRPSSLREACRLLSESAGQAKALAAGTDLLVQIKQEKLRPKAVVSLRDISGLSSVHLKPDEGLEIGAMTTLGVIESSKEILDNFPALAEASGRIASPQIRNRATVGGNLCNSAPSADMAPILIAYGSQVVLAEAEKNRTVDLEDFFTGPGETALRNGEIMKAIRVPFPPRLSFATYLKAGRSAMDIAVVGVGVLATFRSGQPICQDLRLVLGAVAPTPVRAKKAENIAKGQSLDDQIIKEVSETAGDEARPISDVRSSASYRRSLVKVLAQRALAAAQAWAKEGGSW